MSDADASAEPTATPAGRPTTPQPNPTTVDRSVSPYGVPDDVVPLFEQWRMYYEVLPPESLYEANHKIVICVSPKAGSSSFYQWLYRVSTNGLQYFACKDREESDHPKALGECWRSVTGLREHRLNLTNPIDMAPAERKAIAADPDVLRFAITRNPIERAISAWKSKLACPGLYNTDLKDRGPFLELLIRVATGWSVDRLADRSCMSLLEYAQVLNSIPPIVLRMLAFTNGGAHFAPQSATCSLGRFDYDLVQRIEGIRPRSVALRNLTARLKTDLTQHPMTHFHSSTLPQLTAPPAHLQRRDQDNNGNSNISSSGGGSSGSSGGSGAPADGIPGATAAELAMAKLLLRAVYAEDLANMRMQNCRRRLQRRH